jgi:hypothetical protein
VDVIFLRSNELNWEENYQRAVDVLGTVTLLDGSAATSIKNAYELLFAQVHSETFMMVEGDSYVLDACKDYVDQTKPAKFWSTNKYGIQYEHGGVKILNVERAKQQLKNAHIHRNFEVSANLFLASNPVVLSEHRFDWSPRNEWLSIAKELIKLYVWGHYSYLNRWLEHEYPRQVFAEVREILRDTSLSQLFETLLPSLGKIYDAKHPA